MSTIINNMIAIRVFSKYMMYIVITIKLLSISWCMDVLTMNICMYNIQFDVNIRSYVIPFLIILYIHYLKSRLIVTLQREVSFTFEVIISLLFYVYRKIHCICQFRVEENLYIKISFSVRFYLVID